MTNLKVNEKNDPYFVDDLKKSDYCTRKIVAWFRKMGHNAVAKKMAIRPTIDEFADYSDQGDIFVGEKRVEAKQRMIDFNSKEEFPYPTIIVDATHCWDKATPKPYAYVLTNKQMTCCLIVRGSTRKDWTERQKWDRFKKRMRSFYECPIILTEFRKLDVTDEEVALIPSNMPV